MKSSLPNATKAEKRRFEILSQQIGCLACRTIYGVFSPAFVHHLIDPKTGNRISHRHTIPLCDSHHVGSKMSIHKTKLKFADEFGSDDYLLAATNTLVTGFERTIVGGSR